MTDPINLNVRRALKEGDSRLISVKDALEAAAAETGEKGWTKMLCVLYRTEDEGVTFHVDLRVAGCTTLESRGLMLSWIKEEVTEDL